MREIKEIDLNQNVKIDITLKELDVIRVCLAVANDSEIASVFESGNIKYESQEKYTLIKDCRNILESYRVLRKSDEA